MEQVGLGDGDGVGGGLFLFPGALAHFRGPPPVGTGLVSLITGW